MTKRHLEPLLWLLFSGGGVVAAVFLPILVVLFGLAIPLGWVQPDYDQLHAVVGHWLTRLVLLGLLVLMLFHWAHRFRYTLYDWTPAKEVGRADRCALLRRCTGRFARRAVDRLNCLSAAPSGGAHPSTGSGRRMSLRCQKPIMSGSSSSSSSLLGAAFGQWEPPWVRALIKSRLSLEIVSSGISFWANSSALADIGAAAESTCIMLSHRCRPPGSSAPADLAAAGQDG